MHGVTFDVPDQYIDVDFEKEPGYTFGCTGPGDLYGSMPIYEDSMQMLSETEIDATIERMDADGGGAENYITRIFGQKNEGACVANAVTASHEVVQGKQWGKLLVTHLSAISLYKRIGVSPQSGATVDNGISEMIKRGILPLDTPENRARFGDCVMPNTGYYTPYPAGWEKVANLFRGHEWNAIRSVQGIYTALCREEPVIVGRAGHSIMYIRPKRKNGKRAAIYANSWDRWGFGCGDFDYGFGLDTESMVRQSAGWAACLRSIVDPGLYSPHSLN